MTAFTLHCIECGAVYDEDKTLLVCPACSRQQEPRGVTRGVLEVVLETLPQAWPDAPIGSEAFLRAFLPLASGPLPRFPVGATPLLEAPRLRALLDMPHLWVKDDTRNPSGSTKDRASFLVGAKAVEYGFDTVAVASTGNAATAMAAVAAAIGLRAVAFVPASAPEGKLVQLLSYGAAVLPVDGTYDDAFELCLGACERFGWYNRNTGLNPYTVEGKKTAALEMAAALHPDVPDAVVVPTGDGVIAAGIAKGFADLERAGLIPRRPRLIVVQPSGSCAIATALRSGAPSVSAVHGAASVADSLVVETPRNGFGCLRAVRATGGAGIVVSDDEIMAAIPSLAGATGVFAEPAAAAALAGLRIALAEGVVNAGERVVLLITGTGLKDVATAARSVRRPEPIQPDLDAVERAVAGGSAHP